MVAIRHADTAREPGISHRASPSDGPLPQGRDGEMEMRLKDKVALITGGARGIGLGFAEAFVAEGARVVIADINLERATAAASSIGPAVTAVKLDVTRAPDIEAVVKKIDEEMGGIDILVNNAAIFDMAPIQAITEDSYQRVLDVDLKGPLSTMKAVANVLNARGRG